MRIPRLAFTPRTTGLLPEVQQTTHFARFRIGKSEDVGSAVQALDAQGAKRPIQGLVDSVALWFVPAVMLQAC